MTNHQQQLIHPLMVQTVSETHYPNTITIGSAVTTYDSVNEPVFTFTADPARTDIPAYIEPIQSKIGQEFRRKDQTIIDQAWNITLAGYYPTISTLNQAVDELSRTFNIISTNFDAFHTQTNMICELVT